MATTVTSKIGATNSPTTMDYSTVQAWEDACPANLVTADQIWRGECYDQGEFVVAGSVVSFNGTTTDATRYIELTTAAGASFRDKSGAATNPLYANASGGVTLRNSTGYAAVIVVLIPYVRISNLMLIGGTSGAAFGIQANHISATNATIANCVIAIRTTNSTAAGIKAYTSWVVKNCVTYITVNGGATGFNGGFGGAFYGCVAVVCSDKSTGGTALANPYGTSTAVNCAFFGFTTNKSGTWSGNNNATDLSSVGFGSSNQTSLTYANQFQSATSTSPDFRTKSGANLIDNGATDSTNIPTDIIGTSRPSGSAYDIGHWEFAASNPITVTPGNASLTITTFAPTIRLNKIVRPGNAALTLTTFAPTIRLNKIVRPGNAALTLTTFAPTVLTPRVVTPAAASLTLTTFAPNIIVGTIVRPAAATLTLTTFAPTVLAPRVVQPASLALTITTFAPTVVISTPPTIGQRVLSKYNRYNHRPFIGRGASLYAGVGETPEAIQFRKVRILGCRFVRGSGFTIALGLRKGTFIAQVDHPANEFAYTVPETWHGQRVWLQVRTFWNDIENPTTADPICIDVDDDGNLIPALNCTGEIVSSEKRDGGVYRLTVTYVSQLFGLQPTELLIRQTAGPGALADESATIVSRQATYSIDTAALEDDGVYTFALIAKSGSTELQLDTITFTAIAAGPPAVTSLSLKVR